MFHDNLNYYKAICLFCYYLNHPLNQQVFYYLYVQEKMFGLLANMGFPCPRPDAQITGLMVVDFLT